MAKLKLVEKTMLFHSDVLIVCSDNLRLPYAKVNAANLKGRDLVLVTTEANAESDIERIKQRGGNRIYAVNANAESFDSDLEQAVASLRASTQTFAPSATLIRAARACSAKMGADLFNGAGPHLESMSRLAGAPFEFIAGSLLAVASGLATGRFQIHVRDGYDVAPILCMCLVGDASSGKSPAMDAVLRPLRALEAKHHKDYERDVKQALKDGEKADSVTKPPRAIVSNATIEALQHVAAEQARGMICAYDELSEWFSGLTRYTRSSQGDRGTWLASHNGYPLTVDRRTLKVPLQIPVWGNAILGAIPPSVLSSLSDSSELESGDGLDVRMLYLRPALPPVELRPAPADAASIAVVERAIERMFTWRMQVVSAQPIKFAPDALERFERWRFDLLNRARENNAEVDSWVGKLPGLVARIAGTLAVIDAAFDGADAPRTVDLAQLRRAVQLADLFTAHRRKVVLERGAPGIERLATEMASFILEHEVSSLNTFEARRGLVPGVRSEKTLRGVLRELKAANWLETDLPSRPDEPLPKTVLINPKVFEVAAQ